jgi:three-Cys-motif partner protein
MEPALAGGSTNAVDKIAGALAGVLPMPVRSFFDKPTPQSKAKARIVSGYFKAWSNVILSTTRGSGAQLGYFDLYAGTGKYGDGTPSTPLLVLKHARGNPDLCRRLVAQFNDHNKRNASTLRREIANLPGIDRLAQPPKVYEHEVDDHLTQFFQSRRRGPSILFADPFGYKGLTLDLINAVIRDWGCECIFFFNYNRIRAGLNNPVVYGHMERLFGAKRAAALRDTLWPLDPGERERAILLELEQALTDAYGRYVLTFCFKHGLSSRTSHYLIFVTKNFLGYRIMKETMAVESTSGWQDVPSYCFDPRDLEQQRLFELDQPLDKLMRMLPVQLTGKTMTFGEIYRTHSVGLPYIEKNYRSVLRTLEAQGAIHVDSGGKRRRAGTFADHVQITFP